MNTSLFLTATMESATFEVEMPSEVTCSEEIERIDGHLKITNESFRFLVVEQVRADTDEARGSAQPDRRLFGPIGMHDGTITISAVG